MAERIVTPDESETSSFSGWMYSDYAALKRKTDDECTKSRSLFSSPCLLSEFEDDEDCLKQ